MENEQLDIREEMVNFLHDLIKENDKSPEMIKAIAELYRSIMEY